jgi:hypothetical protein
MLATQPGIQLIQLAFQLIQLAIQLIKLVIQLVQPDSTRAIFGEMMFLVIHTFSAPSRKSQQWRINVNHLGVRHNLWIQKPIDVIWQVFLTIWHTQNGELYGKDYEEQCQIALKMT